MTLTNVNGVYSKPSKTTKSKAKAKPATVHNLADAGKPATGNLFPATTLPKPSGYPIPAEVDSTLTTILSWRRAHKTKHEEDFVSWLVGHCIALGYNPYFATTEANVVVDVPRSDKLKPTTLFSSHTDTCHYGPVGGPQKQEVAYDGERGELFLKNAQHGDCLGADDGAGVWLMLEMIKAKVPGTYVFHRGEERGCIGSTAMVRERAQWLERFDVAVAFDRKGFTEIITHQGGGKRCASQKCATALQTQLHKHGLKGMELSPRGSVTDTLRYRGIIAECFNLAVGYAMNHGPDEYVDYAYLVALRDALIKVDWDALPVDRDPKEADPVPYQTTFPPTNKFLTSPAPKALPKPSAKDDEFNPTEEFLTMSHDDLVDYLGQFPDAAGDDIHEILLELVRTRAERDYYKMRGGF